MLCVVSPVLHRFLSFEFDFNITNPPWQKVANPFNEITGAGGIALGEEIPTPCQVPVKLVQPLTVWVTVYVAALITVMDGVVAPLLHNSDPVKFEAVNTELPQLLITETVGAGGITLGADTALPVVLAHPLIVCFTV